MFGKNENIVSMIEQGPETIIATNRYLYVVVGHTPEGIKLKRIKCEIVDQLEPESEISQSDGECDHIYRIGDIEGEPAIICIKCGYVYSEDYSPESEISQNISDISPPCDHDYQIDSVNPDNNVCVKCGHVQSEDQEA